MKWRYEKSPERFGTFSILDQSGNFVGKAFKEEDARLMSCASELLEACKYALKRHQEIYFQKFGHFCDKSCDICFVLEKALGDVK